MARRPVITITGDKQLNRLLRDLAGKDGKAAVRKAARPALRPTLAEAKRIAPRDTGELEESLKIRALKRSRSRVGARVQTAKGSFQGQTFYGGFQEWGWKTGRRGSGNRTHVPGEHFLKRAAEATRHRAIAIYRKILRQEILKRAKRR